MSCPACREADQDGRIAYYRWKTANIGMLGCDEHLQEVFVALTESRLEPCRCGHGKSFHSFHASDCGESCNIANCDCDEFKK